MQDNRILEYIRTVIDNMPSDWLGLTTHRLDIYNEELAKTQFLQQLELLYKQRSAEKAALATLPTAYDYIRLGHPLSCVLEWTIARLNGLSAERVISFSSKITPLLAILRANKFAGKHTLVYHMGDLPVDFDADVVREIYGYSFDLRAVDDMSDILPQEGSLVCILDQDKNRIFQHEVQDNAAVDFQIMQHGHLGSVLVAISAQSRDYISEIQHVRRRETIAMTPSNSLAALQSMVNKTGYHDEAQQLQSRIASVQSSVMGITGAYTKALLGSSGLSIQYAIMMGLIHDAAQNHPGKKIKIIVPPNCYGGTNDQARRVAACLDHVDVVDLPVDGDNDMVRSVDMVLNEIAWDDAVPYIIAEIPTNPRVEVPDLHKLKEALKSQRKTASGMIAVDPVFILDQTFCPNVRFVEEGSILSKVRTISYASGSKFPSGGRCTAGYCVGNMPAAALMEKIEQHLKLCDNEATDQQTEILAEQMPSMLVRIRDAYLNTRDFVTFIHETLPAAKINFVSEELAAEGFTPSVFSLDLPTKGNTEEEREAYKRKMNNKLIDMMISQIPHESKYCVSYGQLKGCYWTIPATSTQGTTKEGDKDYIARVSLSANMDMDLHKQVFHNFVKSTFSNDEF